MKTKKINKMSMTLGELIALSPKHSTKIYISAGRDSEIQVIHALYLDDKTGELTIECR